MGKHVELLAPCGNYESFLAAVNAGADAVYLGGRQFGARAYAENFSEEELIRAIRQAHFSGVKVYLTVNTLVKEQEFSGLYDYLLPLYEAGADGAIVQDMGALAFLRRNFPGLKIHASTQMTITGAYGAACLRELGCERIVPARELSLTEITQIKRKVPVEIEAFIHGAMCYCYSGQCLMSSMIGGRSGNRGRCAGPCRLPYRAAGKEGYYLSLKDMNTLEYIPDLIEAGIDSFKIEGRMKRPEYVAGVVSVYRKYIDRYYQHLTPGSEGSLSPERAKGGSPGTKGFLVEGQDRKMLSALYLRSETGNGYYEKRNGRDMLTLHKPGYNEADEALLKRLREKYVRELPKVEVSFYVRCVEGEPLRGEVCFHHPPSGKRDCGGSAVCGEKGDCSVRAQEGKICLEATGGPVERAVRRALTEAEISAQLVKTGGTPFQVKACGVKTGENAFVPMSQIKALRRELLEKIYAYDHPRKAEKEIKEPQDGKKRGGTLTPDIREEPEGMKSIASAGDPERNRAGAEGAGKKAAAAAGVKGSGQESGYTLTAIVQTREQFEAAFSAMKNREDEYLIVDADLILEETDIQERLSAGKVHWGIKCPLILRESDKAFLKKLRRLLVEKSPEILYCATIDMYAWVKSISYGGKIAGEASLYAWNREAVSFWGERIDRVSLPLELNSKEIRELCAAVKKFPQDDRACEAGWEGGLPGRLEAPVYGRAPIMVSANCVKLSTGNCDRNRKKYAELTDRRGNVFPVYTNCSHCYNILYNCLPTSYAEDLWMLREDGIKAFRLEFTTESGAETVRVMQTFRQLLASERKSTEKEKGRKPVGTGTTKGRFRLGVE